MFELHELDRASPIDALPYDEYIGVLSDFAQLRLSLKPKNIGRYEIGANKIYLPLISANALFFEYFARQDSDGLIKVLLNKGNFASIMDDPSKISFPLMLWDEPNKLLLFYHALGYKALVIRSGSSALFKPYYETLAGDRYVRT